MRAEEMPDARGSPCEAIATVSYSFPPTPAAYVLFDVVSKWGSYAGLNYFGIE